jgi:hypothetical protein
MRQREAAGAAVRHNREISARYQKHALRTSSFNLALCSSLDIDPVTGLVRAAETENKARKHIVQSALKCKTEDDGNNTGNGKQALDRKIKHIGDDGEGRGQINESDQEPSCPKPPSNLQCYRYGVTEGRAGGMQRLIGNNSFV